MVYTTIGYFLLIFFDLVLFFARDEVLDYYQKNPNASQSLKGSLYEEKIIELIKSKINLTFKEINISDAEKIIAKFNKTDVGSDKTRTTSSTKNKTKSKKISKK